MASSRLTARATGPLKGAARAPGDKSVSHRALILGAMASGVTEIDGLLEGEDVLATERAAAAFGACIERLGPGRRRVEGKGRFETPEGVIDCGNSGTGVRLLMGAAAGYPLRATFDGDASLRRRPMDRVLEPLGRMGAGFEGEAARLPLTLTGGGLDAISYRLPVASAQVKSAVLLAGLSASGETRVIEPEPSRDHTERMLRAFGAELTVETEDDGARAVRLRPGVLRGTPVTVPGDPSSAAFPLVAALLVPGSDVVVERVLLNPLRTGLYATLAEMGALLEMADVRDAGGEPVGALRARASALKGVEVPASRAPSMIDEYPILAVAAAFAEGTTVMSGIGELRVKESDRIALTAAGLRACGVEVEEGPDRLVVHGAGGPPAGGAEIAAGGDHRIAMAFLVLGLAARAPVAVDSADMIATSFPDFVLLMRRLGAEVGP